jgi:cell division septation protein DedD
LNNSPKSEVIQSEFIVGCFASEENANAMIRRIKSYGLDAYIFDRSNGLARVSAGSGESDASFNELRSKLSSHGINGWIYRKN